MGAEKAILYVAKDFTPYPGPRKRAMTDEPEKSGEAFLETCLIPWLKKNEHADKLEVNLDGASSYPPSFLEEGFGGAVRRGYTELVERINIVSNDEPELIHEIASDIQDAIKKQKK